MIVTCPGCASKYRVRNEAVPAEGARMRCPKCETLFLAKPPAGGADASNDEFGGMPQTGQGAAPQLTPQGPFAPPGTPPRAPAPAPVTAMGAPPATPFGGAPAPFGAPPFGAAPLFGPPSAAPQPSPFAPPAGAQPLGSAPSFSPPTQPPQPPQPFGAAPFGAAPFAPSAPSPFGAPPANAAPFGAAPFATSAPSPFGGTPAPFGAPQPQQQQPPAFVPPSAAKQAGPVTAMMQTFDESMLSSGPPSTPAPSAAAAAAKSDDPFANLDLGPSPTTNSGPARIPSDPNFTTERPRPTTQNRPTTQTPQQSASPPPVRPVRGDSMVGVIGSWVALFVAVAGAVFGLTFAGWTSESLDLDAAMMPAFEQNFGVRPPRSFDGNDELPLDELRRVAQAKEAQGDLAGAAVAWRRVQTRDPSDRTAATALPRVMTALGERLR